MLAVCPFIVQSLGLVSVHLLLHVKMICRNQTGIVQACGFCTVSCGFVSNFCLAVLELLTVVIMKAVREARLVSFTKTRLVALVFDS